MNRTRTLIMGLLALCLLTLSLITPTPARAFFQAQFLTMGSGDIRYARKGAATTYTAAQTYNTQVSLTGRVAVSSQLVALNGNSQTLTSSATTATIVAVSGSSTGSNVLLPSPATAGQLVWLVNQASVPWTLGGNGATIDGSSAVTVQTAARVPLWYDGTNWQSLSFAPWAVNSINGNLTVAATLTLGGRFTTFIQTPSAGATISATNGSYVELAGNATLPSSPSDGQLMLIKNVSGSSATLSPNSGQTLESGSPGIAMAANACRYLVYRSSGTTWRILGAYN